MGPGRHRCRTAPRRRPAAHLPADALTWVDSVLGEPDYEAIKLARGRIDVGSSL